MGSDDLSYVVECTDPLSPRKAGGMSVYAADEVTKCVKEEIDSLDPCGFSDSVSIEITSSRESSDSSASPTSTISHNEKPTASNPFSASLPPAPATTTATTATAATTISSSVPSAAAPPPPPNPFTFIAPATANPNGETYEGARNDRFEKHGFGLATYKTASMIKTETYEGMFSNDCREGKGKYIYSNGDEYEGYTKLNFI